MITEASPPMNTWSSILTLNRPLPLSPNETPFRLPEGNRSAKDSAETPVELRPNIPQLREVPGGAFRIGMSRVTLDVVIEQLDQGATPEDIVGIFDSLNLADVQAVLGYYEQNKEAVRSYLTRREREADELRREFEARRPSISREELLARRLATENENAPPGQ
jgi:uncharacterized protein (DUF433 family)